MSGERVFQAKKMVRAEALPEGKQDLGCPGKGCHELEPGKPGHGGGEPGLDHSGLFMSLSNENGFCAAVNRQPMKGLELQKHDLIHTGK